MSILLKIRKSQIPNFQFLRWNQQHYPSLQRDRIFTSANYFPRYHHHHCSIYSSHLIQSDIRRSLFCSRRLYSSGFFNSKPGGNNFVALFSVTSVILFVIVGIFYASSKINKPPEYREQPVTHPSETDSDTNVQSVTKSDLVSTSTTPIQMYSPLDNGSNKEELDQNIQQTESANKVPLFDDEVLSSLTYINTLERGFPTHVPYLIIGAGAAGFAASRSIRASDPLSKILMVDHGESNQILDNKPAIGGIYNQAPPPYLRPPLSKELWSRSGDREATLLRSDGDVKRHSWLYYEADSFFLNPEDLNAVEYGGIALIRDDSVIRLDPDTHTAVLASGQKITYDCCLLSTGGKPRHFEQLEICNKTGTNLANSGHISYFRNLADYKNLRNLAEKYCETGGRIVVVGGGYLGSELAISLLNIPKVGNDKSDDSEPHSKLNVVHTFRETVPMGSILPPCLASVVGRFETSRGVELLPASDIVGLSLVSNSKPDGELADSESSSPQSAQFVRMRVRRNDLGIEKVEEMTVDHVVCAIGIEPNTNLAADASLEIDQINGGFLVNAELEARQGIYAAGDAASYWDPVLGCRRRVEHLNFAEETGTLAGKNMVASRLGAKDNGSLNTKPSENYRHQSYMWSSLGSKISWDAVGLVDSKLLVTRAYFASDKSGNNLTDLDENRTEIGGTNYGSIPNFEFGHLNRGVVFYLTPKERKLVGILLWNLDDQIYKDKDIPAPSRLNLARKFLADKHLIGRDVQNGQWDNGKESEDLLLLARDFDLFSEHEEYYKEMKAFFDKHELERSKENDENLNKE